MRRDSRAPRHLVVTGSRSRSRGHSYCVGIRKTTTRPVPLHSQFNSRQATPLTLSLTPLFELRGQIYRTLITVPAISHWGQKWLVHAAGTVLYHLPEPCEPNEVSRLRFGKTRYRGDVATLHERDVSPFHTGNEGVSAVRKLRPEVGSSKPDPSPTWARTCLPSSSSLMTSSKR